jgi:ketosteroid isomerase-like protein
MSQENVEVFRAVFEAWNAGDMDAFRELYDPDAVMRPPEGWPEPGPFFGREAVMREWHQFREAWDTDTVVPISDFIEAADRVVVRQVTHAAGRGPEAQMEMTNVVTLREGRIIYQEFFWNHDEALEAVRLSE